MSLPKKVQTDIKKGVLTEKHGRALKPLLSDEDKFEEAYKKIKKEKMNGDEALSFTKSLRRSERPENHKAFTVIKSANQKYQDLLLLTDFEKFDSKQTEALKKELSKVEEIISRAVKKL